MTVAELIERLSKMPKDRVVTMEQDHKWPHTVCIYVSEKDWDEVSAE